MTQNITSKNTALTQVASTFKCKKFDFSNSYVLDWGCGKGLSKEFCEKTFENCKVELFDPFHDFKSGVQNFCLFSLSADCKYSHKVITCNNVLNVLQDNTLIEVLNGVFACAMVCKVDRIIFKIYQGDKTGLGRVTKKDCYQRNEKTALYLEKINSFSKVSTAWNIRKSGLYIICDRK